MDIWSAGIAEKRAEILKASKNWARQNITSKTSLRVREMFLGSPSISVPAGESGGGGDIVTESCRQNVAVSQFRSAPAGEGVVWNISGWMNGSTL